MRLRQRLDADNGPRYPLGGFPWRIARCWHRLEDQVDREALEMKGQMIQTIHKDLGDRIKRRLCRIGSFDQDEWDFPPKPKGMRWNTYNRAEQKFDAYEEELDRRSYMAACKFLTRVS